MGRSAAELESDSNANSGTAPGQPTRKRQGTVPTYQGPTDRFQDHSALAPPPGSRPPTAPPVGQAQGVPPAVSSALQAAGELGERFRNSLPPAPTADTSAGDALIAGSYGDVINTADQIAAQDPTESRAALEALQGYAPEEQAAILAQIQEFMQGPEGPSQAELLLQSAANSGMSDTLSLARSGRGGAGAQARAMRGALAQNAASGVETARNVGQLRAVEEQQRRQQVLQALGLGGQVAGSMDAAGLQQLISSGALAGGIDQSVLQALVSAGQLDLGALGAGVDVRGQGVQQYGVDANVYATQIQQSIAEFQALMDNLKQIIAGEYGVTATEAGRPPPQRGLIGSTVNDIREIFS